MDIKKKVRQMACGGIFAIMQAGTALAAEGETSSGFTISGTFSKVTSGISSVLQEGLDYAFDNVSSLAWAAIVIGICILLAKAGLSHLSTDSNPADQAKYEGAIVGSLRVAGVAIFAIGVISMAYTKFA